MNGSHQYPSAEENTNMNELDCDTLILLLSFIFWLVYSQCDAARCSLVARNATQIGKI